MKIQKIDLFNFGSYFGLNRFDLHTQNEKRVVIIGGKNGAGKTTLFTAIQVCLYGNLAFGFKTAGGFYLRQVKTLINNQALLDENESAYVEIEFDHVVNGENQTYNVRRTWQWSGEKITEEVTVARNGLPLEEDSFNDFQNYLIHLIPPDLLKLYFFDGEKIADYFLGDQTINIQSALMVLSGNDTFEIIAENIRRLLGQSSGNTTEIAEQYLRTRREADSIRKQIEQIQEEISMANAEIEQTSAELHQLADNYSKKGGVSLEKWTELHASLKEEEEKRERLNWQKKALATDVLPFIILQTQISEIEKQIGREKDYIAHQALQRKIENPEFAEAVKHSVEKFGRTLSQKEENELMNAICGFLLDQDWRDFSVLFGLSQEEERQVLSVLERVAQTKSDIFKKYKKRISASINRSKEVRNSIQNSSIEEFEDFVRMRSEKELSIQGLRAKLEQAEKQLEQLKIQLQNSESLQENARKDFEQALKKQSMVALSGRIILLLEELEEYLFNKLIKSVEHDLKVKFRQLIRKKDFFDDVRIDKDWNVHIIRNEAVHVSDLLSTYSTGKAKGIEKKLGTEAFETLMKKLGCSSETGLSEKLESHPEETIVLPVEMDKEQMSSGEKQIFVMSLYWALMQESRNELPFIIDTPFARIDTEHRKNITEKFFMELKGQLFILSTNEEISNNHMAAMESAIQHVYMLEYGADRKTHIHAGQYFEV